MQWILQDFEDTRKLGAVLERLGFEHTWHKVVPFVGDLTPEPEIPDPSDVVLFGSYTLRHYAQKHGLQPGVFRIAPFLSQDAWHPYLLNGADALRTTLRNISTALGTAGAEQDQTWFMRPIEDTKEVAGRVYESSQLRNLADKVCKVPAHEIPVGSLGPYTELMLTRPAKILTEWRVWVVADEIITASLYKEGRRVVYRPGMDPDAQAFAERLVAENPNYAPAYVMDLCRTPQGLRLLETNCINAAGFYAADFQRLAVAVNSLG
ncbi:MAG: ATP-grasp domain-containing protein [Pseudomonadota bacterium]